MNSTEWPTTMQFDKYNRKSTRQFIAGVCILFGAFVVTGLLEWFGWLPEFGQVLRPLDQSPAMIESMNEKQVIEFLQNQHEMNYILSWDDEIKVLTMASKNPGIANSRIPNPWHRCEVDLKRADPYVVAVREKTGHYSLILFCYQKSECAKTVHKDGEYQQKILHFPGSKDKQSAQMQLEAVRHLIKLQGNTVTSLDLNKSITRLQLEQ